MTQAQLPATGASAPSPPPAAPPLRIYLMYGLTEFLFSRGLDSLAKRLEGFGYASEVGSWTAWSAVANRARDRHPGERPIFMGHSMGADASIWAAGTLGEAGIEVPLLIGFDPTRLAAPVPGNVRRVVNFHKSNSVLGGAALRASERFRGSLVNIDLRDDDSINHVTLDDNPMLHDRAILEVVAVSALDGLLVRPQP